MKRMMVLLAVVSLLSSMSVATVVWENDCSSLDGWGYGAGNGIGVTVVNSSFIQMNSWAWDGSSNAGWTNLWRNTGVVIQPDADYTLTLRVEQYAAGTTVPVSIQNASTSPWSVLVQQDVAFEGTWADYSISFSTKDGANAGAVGGQIAIGVTPGWWKNLGIEHASINEVPEPATLALLCIGSLAALRRRK
jgi:hypothetical protein